MLIFIKKPETAKGTYISKQKSGFTLIELIVVIVILGVLAATAVPKYINYQEQARIAALQALMGTMQSISAMAIAGYMLQKPRPLATDENAADIVAVDGTLLRVQTGIILGGQPGMPSIGGMAQMIGCTGSYQNFVDGYMCNGFFIRGTYYTGTNINTSPNQRDSYGVFRLNNSDDCSVTYSTFKPMVLKTTGCR